MINNTEKQPICLIKQLKQLTDYQNVTLFAAVTFVVID